MSEFKTILESAPSTCLRGLPTAQANQCEDVLNIGLFFDGTDNNKTFHTDPNTNTNIVRLWQAYREKPADGYFRYYVSGVGTPFSELDMKKSEAGGGTAGAGGEARIIYGLLQIVNAVYAFVNDQDARFDTTQLAALCSETRAPAPNRDRPIEPTPEQIILNQLGIPQGLVSAGDHTPLGFVVEGTRRKFFRDIDFELRRQVMTKQPKIKSIYIDAFGFSRGAAQARVFVNWLHDLLLLRGQMFGAHACVRMLGIFDTVASVGLTDAVGASGHGAWATPENLRIHPEVKRCVHYVALHELRTNFPAESVQRNGGIPPNCKELFCPGAHSDVGGGYAPGEQGKGVRMQRNPRYDNVFDPVPDDKLKLSNLPLNLMHAKAAKSAEAHQKSPWLEFDSREGVTANLRERFALDVLDKIRQSVTTYFDAAGVAQGLSTDEALREHGLRYLAWRYRVDKDERFDELSSVKRARKLQDPELADYLEGQKIFNKQIRLLSTRAPVLDLNLMGDKEVRQGFHKHAPEIFEKMKATRLSGDIGLFFDDWVHDSYAGFIGKFKKDMPSWAMWTGTMSHLMAEAQRYVRWRLLFTDVGERLNALTGNDDGTRTA